MAAIVLRPELKRARQRHIRAVEGMTWPMMLTLTRAPRRTALSVEILRETMRAFARLRRTKAFREVLGGIASLEVSGSGEHWHAHIHAIIDARWLDIPPLAAAWRRTIKSRGSIHLQRLRTPKLALYYVTKPPPEAFCSILSTGRFVTAWGTCHPKHQT